MHPLPLRPLPVLLALLGAVHPVMAQEPEPSAATTETLAPLAGEEPLPTDLPEIGRAHV